MLYQIGALEGICRALGGRVQYVKPHGALYNDMMRDARQLRAVFKAVSAYEGELRLMLMSQRDNSTALALSAESAYRSGSKPSPIALTTRPGTWSHATYPARFTTNPKP
jgi:lactam utilization protein B